MKRDFRSGYLALVGLPNAGKSTLTNVVVGEKVAIVTSKAQTTRQRVLGIVNDEQLQAVVVDAPGLVRAEKGLNRFLQKEAQDVIDKADALVAVLNIDCEDRTALEKVLDQVSAAGKPWLGVVTKTDLPMVHRIPVLRQWIEERGGEAVALSAQRNPREVRRELVEHFYQLLPATGAPLFAPELYTTQTLRQMSCEIIREQCFEILRHELPYNLAVQIVKFDESGPIPKIYAELVLNKDSHKSIVIGEGGRILKRIGMSARKGIEKIHGGQVFLDLHVTVKKKWFENAQWMKELGYVVSRS